MHCIFLLNDSITKYRPYTIMYVMMLGVLFLSVKIVTVYHISVYDSYWNVAEISLMRFP